MNLNITDYKVRERALEDLIRKKSKALENAPEGALRVSSRGDKHQYYRRTNDTNVNGKYLKQSEKDLIHALAQKEYDEKVMKAAEREWKLLHGLGEIYESGHTAEEVFGNLPKGKQIQILPIRLPDDVFASRWASVDYAGMGTRDFPAAFISDKGERMRSKSEVIIANMLKKHGVPYRYEFPLDLGGTIIYPDFTILQLSRRRELIWEHMGMMDNPKYLERSLDKVTKYEMNGYYPGENLILTHETSASPLNMRLVENMIEKYCM